MRALLGRRFQHVDANAGARAAIIVHGGAWAIPDHLRQRSLDGCQNAAAAGWAVLEAGGNALDAAEAATRVLEDDDAFDAGTGSVLNAVGEVEMDAMMMDGDNLGSGAVAAVQQVKNPITLARAVMEQTDHCLLVADGARRFADEIGIPRADPDELVTEAGKAEFELFSAPGYSATVSDLFSSGVSTADTKLGHDTVGCVAFDGTGRIAAATSTGGITMKRPGRVGDSPLIGSGGYADSAVGGCSTTGHGEAIMRTLLASRAVAELGDSAAHNGDVSAAAKQALLMMWSRVQGRGGAIMIDSAGNVGKHATTKRMAWASCEGTVGCGAPLEEAAGVDNDDAYNELGAE